LTFDDMLYIHIGMDVEYWCKTTGNQAMLDNWLTRHALLCKRSVPCCDDMSLVGCEPECEGLKAVASQVFTFMGTTPFLGPHRSREYLKQFSLFYMPTVGHTTVLNVATTRILACGQVTIKTRDELAELMYKNGASRAYAIVRKGFPVFVRRLIRNVATLHQLGDLLFSEGWE